MLCCRRLTGLSRPNTTARCHSVREFHSPRSRSFQEFFVASEKIVKLVLLLVVQPFVPSVSACTSFVPSPSGRFAKTSQHSHKCSCPRNPGEPDRCSRNKV
jgi:hypothetical protein